MLRAVVFALLVLPGTAQAAWSAPQDLGPPTDDARPAGLAVRPSGAVLLGWVTTSSPVDGDLRPADPGPNRGSIGRVAGLDADGRIAAPRSFGRTIAAGPQPLPGGGSLVLTTRTSARSVQLRLERLDAAGGLTRSQALTTAPDLSGADLAVDPRGRAVAVWAQSAPRADGVGDRYRLRVAVFTAAGSPAGATRTLETTRQSQTDYGGQVAAAIAKDGSALVAFATARGRTRTVDLFTRARTGAFGRRLVAGPHEGGAALAATYTTTGRPVVVWGGQDGGEEANMPWRIRAATLAGRTVRRQLIDPGAGADRPNAGVAVAALPGGRVAAGWGGVVGGELGSRHPVRVATTDAAGRFGARQELTADGVFGGLAARADGALLATWATVSDLDAMPVAPTQARAAFRAPGAAAFAPDEAKIGRAHV